MTFEASSAPIVQLAWERRLHLPEGILLNAPAGPHRIMHPTIGSKSVTYLRLWHQSILLAPASVLEAAAELTDDQLSDHSTLMQLTRTLGGHGLGMSALYYADDLPLRQPAGEVSVSLGNPEAVMLEGLCPPDDVNEVALAGMPHKYTVMNDGAPLACAAYAEWEGLLAQLGTLVAPAWRRSGLGVLATSIAAHEALAAGLIVQWRTDVNNSAANALAVSLGFSLAGLQTSVRIQ